MSNDNLQTYSGGLSIAVTVNNPAETAANAIVLGASLVVVKLHP